MSSRKFASLNFSPYRPIAMRHFSRRITSADRGEIFIGNILKKSIVSLPFFSYFRPTAPVHVPQIDIFCRKEINSLSNRKFKPINKKSGNEENRFFQFMLFICWCLGTESNRRHRDFQSLALPTELPRPGAKLFIHENKSNVQSFF